MARTGIDQFVLAELERRGFRPAPPADRRTLLRRATFDLLGLPPTPEEVEAFLADKTPDAFARVVERLLASPHYGERWGRHWLDVARYADSSGKDENHACANAFRYRDYVVRAFNDDKPFDQFVQEQIAGDLLPATDEAQRYELLTATGFLQLGPKALAEQDKPKLLIDVVDEQIDVVSRGLLGLTVSCARCHDHKFDPIPAADYYALAGIFQSTRSMENLEFVSAWLESPLADQVTLDRAAAHRRDVARNQQALADRMQEAKATLTRTRRADLVKYLRVASEVQVAQEASVPVGPATEAARKELQGPVLERFTTRLTQTRQQGKGVFAAWVHCAGLPAGEFAVKARQLLEQLEIAESSTPAERLVAAGLKGFAPESREALADRYGEIFAAVDRAWAESQQVAEGQAKPVRLADAGQEELRQLLYGPDGLFAVSKEPREHFLSADRQALAELEQQRDRLVAAAPPAVPMSMSVSEGTIADAPIHIRGDHLKLGERIPRGFLQIVALADPPAIPADQSGRLQLAQWIARPDHPLTSRVLVNRVWQWHFGQGLCRSPDNFGLTGELPSHPELLDWLAGEFVSRGWSIKALHRLIMLSSTYQMSGAVNAAAATADPENESLWRFPRRRLEAEELRDALLTVSGQLDRAVGGNLFNYANREPHVTYYKGPVNYDFPRRSLYLPVVRNAMFDVFELFDHGDALTTLARRDQTIVAPQALFLLNSDFVLDSARRLAERSLENGSAEPTARIRRTYQLVLSRPPLPGETERVLRFLERLNMLAAESQPDPALRSQLIWQTFCHSLLATNEFLYVD